MLAHLGIWLNHFEYHAQRARRLPAGVPNALTMGERRLIARSIATFQLGEQSQGLYLLRTAWRFARAHEAPALARITELLIREEQQHAALLRGFMREHAIPIREHDWTDTLFRQIRRLGGFELSLAVLLTAELIGNVYYRALEHATGCQPLRLLCRMLVADELAHVGFESDVLLAIRAQQSAPGRLAREYLHRGFLLGTACVVWVTHRAVLRRASYSPLMFLRACQAQYAFYLRPPEPNSWRTGIP
jgi:hypothetical protein